jgi:hypothetical protein
MLLERRTVPELEELLEERLALLRARRGARTRATQRLSRTSPRRSRTSASELFGADVFVVPACDGGR